ncbi:MAG: hypothetical protein AB1490_04010 [Pseudomonadota bacterium]
MSQQSGQFAVALSALDNSGGIIHTPRSSTGRAQVRLWIGGELKLRLISPTPPLASAPSENSSLERLSRGVAAVWRRVIPTTPDIHSSHR